MLIENISHPSPYLAKAAAHYNLQVYKHVRHITVISGLRVDAYLLDCRQVLNRL